MSLASWGAVLGLAVAIGLLSVAAWSQDRRPLRIAERVGPYVSGAAALGPHPLLGPVATLVALMTPSESSDGGRRTARRGSTPGSAGAERATWTAAGGAVGACAGLVLAIDGSSPGGVVILGVLGAGIAWLADDRRVARGAGRRRRRIEEQFPTVAELLAFAVAAGASPLVALERVAEGTAGALADGLTGTIDDVRGGMPLDIALRALAERVGVPAVRRFVDGVVIAIERGTPLVEVMRAQAADARAEQRRRLMETAGRKDVAMLVPVVFLILPTVVLVALFPGIQGLRLVVP